MTSILERFEMTKGGTVTILESAFHRFGSPSINDAIRKGFWPQVDELKKKQTKSQMTSKHCVRHYRKRHCAKDAIVFLKHIVENLSLCFASWEDRTTSVRKKKASPLTFVTSRLGRLPSLLALAKAFELSLTTPVVAVVPLHAYFHLEEELSASVRVNALPQFRVGGLKALARRHLLHPLPAHLRC